MNRISVSGNEYLECCILYLSYPSFKKISLKFLQSGFFFAELYISCLGSVNQDYEGVRKILSRACRLCCQTFTGFY